MSIALSSLLRGTASLLTSAEDLAARSNTCLKSLNSAFSFFLLRKSVSQFALVAGTTRCFSLLGIMSSVSEVLGGAAWEGRYHRRSPPAIIESPRDRNQGIASGGRRHAPAPNPDKWSRGRADHPDNNNLQSRHSYRNATIESPLITRHPAPPLPYPPPTIQHTTILP